MAVTWYWKEKRGEIHYYDQKQKQHFVLGMYGGNMLAAIIYRYKKKNEQTQKLEKWYNFIVFINDIDHLKRLLNDDKDCFRDLLLGKPLLRKFKLNVTSKSKYANEEMLKVAKLLAKYGYKVELY